MRQLRVSASQLYEKRVVFDIVQPGLLHDRQFPERIRELTEVAEDMIHVLVQQCLSCAVVAHRRMPLHIGQVRSNKKRATLEHMSTTLSNAEAFCSDALEPVVGREAGSNGLEPTWYCHQRLVVMPNILYFM